MNVNRENRYVSTVETTTKRLNKFYQPHGLHTTFDSGKLIPIYLKEVLPNDVRKLKWSAVTRLLTPKFPTMDNAKLDTYFFYVRNRDIWDHWQEFMGYSKTAWTPNVKYSIPTLIFMPSKMRVAAFAAVATQKRSIKSFESNCLQCIRRWYQTNLIL